MNNFAYQRRIHRSLIILMCVFFVPTIARGDEAQAIQLKDLEGVVRNPLDLGDTTAAVFFFISTECPISNGYAPEMNRICKDYGDQKVNLYFIYTEPGLAPAKARQHVRDYGLAAPALLDGGHRLADRLGITLTPEVAVVGKDGAVLYRGRIDDLYVSLGKRRYHATSHDLRDALAAIVAGRPVPNPRTRAVGCSI